MPASETSDICRDIVGAGEGERLPGFARRGAAKPTPFETAPDEGKACVEVDALTLVAAVDVASIGRDAPVKLGAVPGIKDAVVSLCIKLALLAADERSQW